MITMSQLEREKQETESIINELLEDGSDPEALYTIEHHVSCENANQLSTLLNEAFKIGYEIADIEELDVQNDLVMYCSDLIIEAPLNAEVINSQIEMILILTEKHQVNYDGWGTYFEGDEGELDEDDDFYDEDEDDENHPYHS